MQRQWPGEKPKQQACPHHRSPPVPVVYAGPDRHGNPRQRQRNEHPADVVEIRDQGQDGFLRLGQDLLRDLDARCTDC